MPLGVCPHIPEQPYTFPNLAEEQVYALAVAAQALQYLGYILDDQRITVPLPTGTKTFSFLHSVQTGTGLKQFLSRWIPGYPPRGVELTSCIYPVQTL